MKAVSAGWLQFVGVLFLRTDTSGDECAGVTCQNGGTCVDGYQGYVCRCHTGWTGIDCTTEMVDGKWSAWGPWGDCSKTCDVAVKSRGRHCNNPVPQNGGRPCEGDNAETASCNNPDCSPAIMQCGEWGEFGACSASCGNGFKTRYRECDGDGIATTSHMTRVLCITMDCNKTEADVCLPNPCEKEGTCRPDTASDSGYVCQCLHGYGGQNCAEADVCSPNPCENEGTCSPDTSSDSGYVCQCLPGYRSQNCADNDQCDSDPCHNGGTCQDDVNKFSCDCAEGFTGITCEIEIDGAWSAWGRWGDCSNACDAPVKSRERYCNNPVPQNDGRPCEGDNSETALCENPDCSPGRVWNVLSIIRGQILSAFWLKGPSG